MKDSIANLLKSAPGAEPVYFEHSDWFEEESSEEIEAAIKVYEKHYERRLGELISILGEPTQTEITQNSSISEWCPEAIRAACWETEGKTICLALEHHDKETPVGVVIRCLTAEEIAELSE